MNYMAVVQGLAGVRDLVPADKKLSEIVKDPNKDYYKSIYYYNDSHYEKFKTTKSIAGITDVTTDTLFWDFDSADNTDKAKEDAVELCSRLLNGGFPIDCIRVAFSGKKGFSVEIKTTKTFTVDEFKGITSTLAAGLATYDVVVSNPSRIVRIPCTRHPDTGLYKLPITLEQLDELPASKIKELAKDLDNASDEEYVVADVPLSIYEKRFSSTMELPTRQVLPESAQDLDFKSKPKGMTNCKYAMLNGFFPGGQRDNAITALAATLKAQGYPKNIVNNMLKGTAELQAQIYSSKPFAKEDINKCVESVFKPTWNGAQFSCKSQFWLKEICDSLGPHKCKAEAGTETVIAVDDMAKQFQDFSENIDQNTIKTGLKEVDDRIRLTIGMPVALLGAPSSGKTSLSLDILANTSKAGINSVFFSMDMYGPLVYQKQIARVTGYRDKEIHKIFREDKKQAAEIMAMIKEEYKNVKFSLKAGHTVQDMRDIINGQQEKTGEKVKLVLIDYLECISGPYSDATANMSKVAGELRDFATEMSICNIVLVQPPKSAGDASCELTSMRQIKGASMLEQSFRAILGIYREGFGPKQEGEDNFITVNALKNTMGELFSIDYRWDGSRQRIDLLDYDGEAALADLRERKKLAKTEGGFGEF